MSTTELRRLTDELAQRLAGGPHEELATLAADAAERVAEALDATNSALAAVSAAIAPVCSPLTAPAPSPVG